MALRYDEALAVELASARSLSPPTAGLARGRTRAADALGSAPHWEHHDRTHLQLELDYPAGAQEYCWEAYFFMPQSFRLGPAYYDEQRLYEDLVSYVRLPARERTLRDVVETALPRLERILRDGDDEARGHEARGLACAVRASVRFAMRDIESERTDDPDELADLIARAGQIVTLAREALSGCLEGPEPMRTTAAWVLEDISLMVEQFLSRSALLFAERDAEALAEEARQQALRVVRELEGWSQFPRPPAGRLTRRDIERFEFLRHTLKRFTSSVLWLDFDVRDPSRWAKQALFALAASGAMAFAVVAALWNGDPLSSSKLGLWLVVAIVAYAVKDRIKAWLQAGSSRWLRRHFPDRRWHVWSPEKRQDILAVVDETTRFRDFEELPPEVLATRRMTRRHPLEEIARPEDVLWHRKKVRLYGDAADTGLTEVFRLDLARWLANTDDPKTSLVLADAERGVLRKVTAPRVYNIAVVHRAWPCDAERPPPPFRRERVVVSRKGIRRLETIY